MKKEVLNHHIRMEGLLFEGHSIPIYSKILIVNLQTVNSKIKNTDRARLLQTVNRKPHTVTHTYYLLSVTQITLTDHCTLWDQNFKKKL